MSNFKNVALTITGLEANRTYFYAFNGTGGNWPATITNSSGILAADSPTDEYEVNTSVQFCATTGSCYGASGALPYTIESTRLDNSDVFTLLNFILKDSTTSGVVLTRSVRVNCGDCILSPRITPFYTATLTNTNSTNVNLNISDLVVGETYTYRFYGLDGNWPVMLSNISGTIIPTKRDDNVIVSRLTFVESTGLFAGDNNKLIDPLAYSDKKDLYAVVYATLTAASSPTESIKSDNIFINCNDCLPLPSITPISDTTLSLDNKQVLSVNIQNLQKQKTYNYQFHSVAGNWPINISNVSGSFTTNASSFTLKNKISFCDSTGICGSNPNTILNTGINSLDKNDKYITAYLYIQPTDALYPNAYSNHFTVSCNNCLNKPVVTMPSSTSTTSQHYDISTTMTNLVVGQRYNYSFSGVYGNWPVVIEPVSGTIIANSTSETTTNKATFCFPTGDALGQAGLLTYSINSVNQDYPNKLVKMRVNLVNAESSDINATSKEFTLTCDDCLPCLNCSTIFFSGGPILELPLDCCSGTDMVFVNITGANPNNSYRYELSSLSGDINFVPSTGLVYVKNNGESTIPVLMQTVLVSGEQALAQAKLVDITTSAEAVDYLGLVCGSGLH